MLQSCRDPEEFNMLTLVVYFLPQTANPRFPLVTELKEILLKAYDG